MPVASARPGFRIEQVILRAESLEPGRPPVRFAHLTDLHLRVFRQRHGQLVEAVNAWKPSFLCLTGDVFGGRAFTWDAAQRLISRFECPCGIFACPGNHEAKSMLGPAALKELMARWGADLLINESRTLVTPSGTIAVAGLDDLAQGWPSFDEALRDSAAADYVILLSHAPLAAKLVRQAAHVDLMLSGHTHGGQIRVPLLWTRVLPTCHGGFSAGLYEMPWGHLYVNRGFGGSTWMPLRFRCPAEVAFFEVRPT